MTTHTILRLPDVKVRTGLSRSTLYQRIAEGMFPKPVSLGGRAVGWLEAEVQEWLQSRVNARQQQGRVRGAAEGGDGLLNECTLSSATDLGDGVDPERVRARAARV